MALPLRRTSRSRASRPIRPAGWKNPGWRGAVWGALTYVLLLVPTIGYLQAHPGSHFAPYAPELVFLLAVAAGFYASRRVTRRNASLAEADGLPGG
ncbi:hypothetical protein [Paludibacterium yongneupense]|uniref:hypothetical protein n=1 Tax=Paludibacterium yongneupense TaxID=400061 RepID=UPI00048EBB74|nr:hypothetical protein [Paludibacterium yongneupense]